MDYGEDLNFWGPSYYHNNEQDVSSNSIPYRLDLKDLGKDLGNTDLFGSGLKMNGADIG